MKFGKAVLGVLGALFLCGALTACGGGEGGTPPPNPQAQATGLPKGTWQAERLSLASSSLYPGNTFDPFGGEPPYALWVERQADGTTSLKQSSAAASTRGIATSTLLDGLPGGAANNATIAVRAGSWTLIAWTESDMSVTTDDRLYLRLKGPGVDSGSVQVSNKFQGAAWDVRLVLDANGAARAYWDDMSYSSSSVRAGVNGRVVSGAWVPQPDLGRKVSSLVRNLVGADGQGWWIVYKPTGDSVQYEAMRVTAAEGAGEPVRVDETPAGKNPGRLVASAEGGSDFTMATYLRLNDSSGCLAVRRMRKGALQPSQCINVAGADVPNGNYMSLASNSAGDAVLVWSTGEYYIDRYTDRALFVSLRSRDGVWSAPSLLSSVPPEQNGNISLLSGLDTAIGPTGQAVAVYRSSQTWTSTPTAKALFTSTTGTWSQVTELAYGWLSNRSVSLAFNGQGVPGVLQLVGDRNSAAVLMSTLVGGNWKSETLRSELSLAYINSSMLSTSRLMPQGEAGWLAAWDEGRGFGDPSGYRELWAAEYR